MAQFAFEKSDDGYRVERIADGRTVARITTLQEVEQRAKDDSGRTVRLQPKVEPLPKGQRIWHFSGARLTDTDLEALVSEAAAVS